MSLNGGGSFLVPPLSPEIAYQKYLMLGLSAGRSLLSIAIFCKVLQCSLSSSHIILILCTQESFFSDLVSGKCGIQMLENT